MKKLLFITSIILIFFSCKKQKEEPRSVMCPNKTSYKVTDTIVISNCSQNYTSFRWMLPDSTTSTDSTIRYKPATSGYYTFRLYVKNNHFPNEYPSEYRIFVNP